MFLVYPEIWAQTIGEGFEQLAKVINFRAFVGIIRIVCACPYSSNIGLSAMTLYYPVQDKTTTRTVNTENYYTKI